MNQIPGTKTSTKTSTVNGVTTVVTTVTAPGQPTRITTTTTTKVPAGQQLPAAGQRFPTQPGQPQPQGRPQPQKQLEPEPKRKSGFFSNLKKHITRTDDPKKSPSRTPSPVQQQPQYQQQPQPNQKPTQNPIPAPVARYQTDDGPVDQLAEKMRQAALNRPPVVEHHTSSSTTTTQNGRVVSHTESSEDAIALLKKSQPYTAPNFSGQRLDVSAIDFSREDAHARACPASEAVSIPRLSHYLTSPCSGNQVSQLRCIFTWLANNIAYDVPNYLSGNYGDQSPEGVLRTRKAVCEGYANLFVALAEPAGLKVKKIIGVARGVDVQVGDERLGSPHAWNAVKIDGEYLLIDSTWGAGVCDLSTRSFRKLFRPFFFLLRPNRLIYTHWPEDPMKQYLDPPIDERVFRGLPAVKPESWTLGIKLSGKHRGQVVRTKNDYVEVEIRLKKRPSDGATGKIVARLNWKGQAVPTSIQWVREDAKYVYMAIKCWCPSSGSGELGVFGWPPGGDQTKNGPQCMSFKVINDGSGRAAKPLLQQYVVKGFAFSVLEPITAQVKKNVPQVIRVRVFDVEKGVKPALALQGPDGGMPERLSQVEPGVFEMTKVLSAGQWKIVHMTSEYGFSFAAIFDAV
ncbi:hypothetical protein BC939DRAFT_502294 [Gamsiella multidivaricata]|uniref:uncharacterized protein n=1 Tax=Gamsiella multidivaricata TaxID=101098 RepID=UPI002220AC00|nr:uncharacterized protein BC939DRAFT_502294 [Gamsiella multidivaricata]KAI7825353.1 hypothetical protein BC939DRAFT_502294 [Gamsiella multidivaricata]